MKALYLLTPNGIEISDYEASWSYQKQFWVFDPNDKSFWDPVSWNWIHPVDSQFLELRQSIPMEFKTQLLLLGESLF